MELPAQLKDLMNDEISLYQQQTSKDLKYLRSQMVNEVEGIHKLFLWMIGLIVAIADYEDHKISKKKSPQALNTEHVSEYEIYSII